jgi:hypothetical protein
MSIAPPAWLERSAHRSNPCIDLEVDILAVERVAGAWTKEDWDAGTKTNVGVDPDGVVRLSEGTPTTVFEQATQTPPTRQQWLRSNSANRPAQYALYFFPDPSKFSGTAFVLHSVEFYARRSTDGVSLQVHLEEFDENWRPIKRSDPIPIVESQIPRGSSALITLNFRQKELLLTVDPALIRTRTGPGRNNAGALRELNKDAASVSHLHVWKPFAIVFTPVGASPGSVSVETHDPASGAAKFDVTQYWRTATSVGRHMGPYDPLLRIAPPLDTSKNPDDFLLTGAVPGDSNQAPHYGALQNNVGANTFGLWGIARRVVTAQDEQNPIDGQTDEQPWHRVKAVAYSATGNIVKVLDLGAVPVNDVQIRLDDWTPKGTALAYSIRGSNTSATGPWTFLTSVQDGDEIRTGGLYRRNATTGELELVTAGSFLYRWYELTASFTASTGNFMSPALQSWMMVERRRFSTYRYLRDFDAEVSADPVTGEVKIQELSLSVMRLGPRNFRDLATRIASGYPPSRLEAEVYVASTRDRSKRYYLNTFRLEQRTPESGAERFTFLSGLDRLKAHVPPKTETYTYPADGTHGVITARLQVGSTAQWKLTAAGPFPTTAPTLAGYKYVGISGEFATKQRAIDVSPANTGTEFWVTFEDAADAPQVGDKFEIHSQVFQRQEKIYTAVEYATVYEDVLVNQLRVPSRYRGQRPKASTGPPRTTTNRLTSDGRPGADVLAELALHAGDGTVHKGGVVAWRRGRISYTDIYGEKVSRATWDERHYIDLETPTGADRRMPAIAVKYGWDLTANRFTNEAVIHDATALLALGLPNLFDESSPFTEEFSKWNDEGEARRVGELFRAAWATGVRIWKVKTILPYPWLELGDAVTILTEQYTDRRSVFLDGLTDTGSAIAGRVSALGVIVMHNLWGTEFLVAIRGLHAISSGASGTGTLGGAANPTYGTPVGQAAQISYPFTYDERTVKIEWWSQQFTSDPGAVVDQDNVSGATLVTITRRDDNRSSVVMATTTNNWRLTTRVAYDRFNRRGTKNTVKTQAIGTAPGAPGTPTSVSETSSSVTNRVPTNASSTTAWKIRTYRNGVQWGSDINVAAGAGANQDVTHSGLDVGTSYTWEYSHVDGSGLESAKSASLTHATASGTLPTPTFDSLTRNIDQVSASWTPGAGTPEGVTYELREAAGTGGPYTTFKTTTATSTTGFPANNPAFCVVRATKTGWTSSAHSNERSA